MRRTQAEGPSPRRGIILCKPMPPVHGKIRCAGKKLHAPPSRIGKIAALTKADTLVLSHFTARSLRRLNKNLDIVKDNFEGKVFAVNTLDCIGL